jgi:DNA-binding CsgD family transcriptional regulator
VTPDQPIQDRVYALWDRLADFDAAQVDAALTFLLGSLCDIVDARNADWIGVVRLADVSREDPAHGWRPPVVHFLHATEQIKASVKEQTRRLDQKMINVAARAMVARSGRFRACRLSDLVPPEWFESEFYRSYYHDCGHTDAVYVAFPINEDAESYFGIFRGIGQAAFSEEERDTLAYVLRGIKWFHRQLLLSHGLLVAQAPLTQVERRVLQGLLTGATEKQIAAEVGQSHHTTHEYVSAIYRKFGVNNRSTLMALWLGSAP